MPKPTYRVTNLYHGVYNVVHGEDRNTVVYATVKGEDRANRLCRILNSHAVLVAASEKMLAAIATGEVHCDVVNGRFWSAKADMEAALSLAEPKE